MENDRKPTNDGAQGSDDKPLNAVPSRVEHGEPQANGHRCRSRAEKHPMEWFLESGIFLLLLFTLIATSVAACYTRKQWLTADDSEKRDLRAYVYLETHTVPFPRDGTPNRYAVALKLTNNGKTWARKLIVSHNVVTTRQPEPFDTLTWDEKDHAPMILGPGQTFELQWGEVSFTDVIDIADGKKWTDYVAAVKYQDTLSPDPIIWRTQISLHLLGDHERHIAFNYLPTHNCADDDCPK
jgi:hypothetical protein